VVGDTVTSLSAQGRRYDGSWPSFDMNVTTMNGSGRSIWFALIASTMNEVRCPGIGYRAISGLAQIMCNDCHYLSLFEVQGGE